MRKTRQTNTAESRSVAVGRRLAAWAEYLKQLTRLNKNTAILTCDWAERVGVSRWVEARSAGVVVGGTLFTPIGERETQSKSARRQPAARYRTYRPSRLAASRQCTLSAEQPTDSKRRRRTRFARLLSAGVIDESDEKRRRR